MGPVHDRVVPETAGTADDAGPGAASPAGSDMGSENALTLLWTTVAAGAEYFSESSARRREAGVPCGASCRAKNDQRAGTRVPEASSAVFSPPRPASRALTIASARVRTPSLS